MKRCPHCGAMIADDNARFCLSCGKECPKVEEKVEKKSKPSKEGAGSLVGDKNLINDSTIIGKQEKYEASNITIHNNITEDHSHTTVVCAVSGKRIYMDQSIECPVCGKPVAQEYYVEQAKRCERCDQAAREEFRR
ncbi:MAG: zinc-ribbon domain-containing protein, partial [Alistipes sp.]|nr:zinc-ribbon domain-containing protein [Alistipes sp.]